MTTLVSRTPERIDPGEAVGVAVVGCGYWGPNLIRNFFDTPGCRVAAACDMSDARLEAISRRHPSLTPTNSYDDLLDDPTIHAIAIATPVHSHYSLAKRALEAGKHVLVEKPMTMTS
ncbi:MAG TPA: Gfo/Idh/MocA family oxidoreductase, partial [Dehalococcoidia bacterium]